MKARSIFGKAVAQLVFVLAFAGVAPAYAQLLHVRVSEGTLTPRATGAAAAFLGVPYAAPPIGSDRWKPPRAAARWQGERKANLFSASCQQTLESDGRGPWTPEYMVSGAVSEDCLYLNVWTAARTARERRPVLFWIHGGGFRGGSGSVPVYDGSALAAKGIVVVTVNYRLGVYGFFAHPDLTAESPAHASGDYGLLDLIAALRWVHGNIGAFGGDPARIHIGGHSAGADAVHHLIASPLAKGLFVGGIAESGSGIGIKLPDRAAAESLGKVLSDANHPLTLDGLRKLCPAELNARLAACAAAERMKRVRFTPSVDGLVFPDESFVGANTSDVPVLTGMTADEGSFRPTYGETTAVSFRQQIETTYEDLAGVALSLYPANTDAEAGASSKALARDSALASMSLWARARLSRSHQPVYAYLWTHVEPGPQSSKYLAFHDSDVPYVFDTLDKSQRPFTAKDHELAALLGSYWIHFVKSGDPNGTGLPRWPKFAAANARLLEIGDATQERPILDEPRMALFERFAARGGPLEPF